MGTGDGCGRGFIVSSLFQHVFPFVYRFLFLHIFVVIGIFFQCFSDGGGQFRIVKTSFAGFTFYFSHGSDSDDYVHRIYYISGR